VDLHPQYNGSSLFIHYGSPLITRSNTVILPVKTGATNGFEVEALAATNGAVKWVRTTDYILPPDDGIWVPSFSGTLTPKNRLYFPGAGGTVYYCDTPDTTNPAPVIGQMAFYGLNHYSNNINTYVNKVFINTPITSDRYGNIFFGFQVTGNTPQNLQSGIARIDFNGVGTQITAADAAGDGAISKVVMNCAPALSNDHKTLYLAVNSDANGFGYLVALDSRTLATLHVVRLKDVVNTGSAPP